LMATQIPMLKISPLHVTSKHWIGDVSLKHETHI
jgi:hypothetical protein